MTENRCIEVLKEMKHMFTETCAKIDENTALDMAVEAIKENQQYRAIGTAEDIYNMLEVLNRTVSEFHSEVSKYRAIGTIEDFKALKEKSVAKKAEYDNDDEIYICPSCGKSVGEHQNYCWHCGQSFET